MNPSRQINTLLLQVDETVLHAETALHTETELQDNIIFTSRSEMPSKYKKECVRAPSPWVVLISRLIVICVIPMILIATLQQTARGQQEKAEALQFSIRQIRTVQDRQSELMANFDI